MPLPTFRLVPCLKNYPGWPREWDLKTQREEIPTPGSRRLWFILGVIVLALLIMAVAAALALLPATRAEVRGAGSDGSVDALVGSPTAAGRPEATPVAGPVHGGLSDPDLKSDVWSTVGSFYRNVRDCPDVSSIAIEMIKEPDAAGVWKEAWSVSACGETAILTITFTPSPQGGIMYDISE